jgi:plastocyanin
MRPGRLSLLMALFVVSLACGGGSGGVGCSAAGPAPDMVIGPAVEPTTAAAITAVVKFDGPVPAPTMMRIDGDPKCVAENGGVSQRPSESVVVGDNQALQNVFVYVKDGPTANYAFPIPAEPVVLDQQKCRYTPHVVGVRVGQRLSIRNSDPLLHNVRADGKINQPFNMSTPLQGMSFDRTFATREVMVPMRCDVHNWMSAFVGAMEHPFFGVSDADGRVALNGLPPGTYTIEAWHEQLGTETEQVTVGAKESKDVSFTFSR